MPASVLRRLIPAACGIFLVGFVISAAFHCADRAPALENGVMSDLLSREDNPRGYLFSAIATVVCGVLLLPAATLFRRACAGPHRRWAVRGAWLYRVGLIAAIAIGATTPLQQPYIPIHIWMAFLAFACTVAGLAVGLGVAAVASTSARVPLAGLAALQVAALLFLGYISVSPEYLDGRLGLLAVSEWLLCSLIAAGTVALAAALVRASSHQGDSCRQAGPPDPPPAAASPPRS
jgi:hypothetical protein